MVLRVSEVVRDAILARADKEESVDSCLRRAFDLPPLDESLSAISSLPIKALDVGQYVVIPWPKDPKTGLAVEAQVAKIKRAIYNYARKSHRQFRTVGSPAGLQVWRAL